MLQTILNLSATAATTLLLLFLPLVHLYMTGKTHCIQRKIFRGIRLSLGRGDGNVSPFGALSVTLASTIGTGNIIGVGAAVAMGGPGAVFWIVVTGFFAIATKYAEVLMALRARVRGSDGIMRGGAMYVLAQRFHMPVLGGCFALFAALASLGIGGSVQSRAIASALPLPNFLVGIVVCGLAAAALGSGFRSLVKICERLVPFMAVTYVAGCFALLMQQREFILPAVALILRSALAPQAAAGGISAAILAMRCGVARGLFSNEAGLGSAPIAACSVDANDAPKQALVAATATFWDTVVVCSITGLTVVSGLLAHGEIAIFGGEGIVRALFSFLPFGNIVLGVSLFSFAFSSIIGWSVYGLRGAEYLGGKIGAKLYLVVFLTAVFMGAIAQDQYVWLLADILNTLMALPNLYALMRTYVWRSKTRRREVR